MLSIHLLPCFGHASCVGLPRLCELLCKDVLHLSIKEMFLRQVVQEVNDKFARKRGGYAYDSVLKFLTVTNYMLMCFEHEKCFINSGPERKVLVYRKGKTLNP